jgi:hypothetical protein
MLKNDMSIHQALVTKCMPQFEEHLIVAHNNDSLLYGKKSTSMHPSAFHKSVTMIFSHEGMVLVFFFGRCE